MTFYPDERIALFIDGANLYSTGKSLDYEIDFKKMLALFKTKGRLIFANYYTALLEHDDYSPIRPLMDWLDYNGYQIVSKPAREYSDREGRRRIKGNMDIEICVDMMELADNIDHFLLMSGDGDFRYLLKSLQRQGKRVTIISTRKSNPPMLSDELRRQADGYMELADMGDLIGRPKRDNYVEPDYD